MGPAPLLGARPTTHHQQLSELGSAQVRVMSHSLLATGRWGRIGAFEDSRDGGQGGAYRGKGNKTGMSFRFIVRSRAVSRSIKDSDCGPTAANRAGVPGAVASLLDKAAAGEGPDREGTVDP